MALSPWEAALGGDVRIPSPGGIISLKVPENSVSGQRLRVKGRGLPGKIASKNGDLFAVLKVVLPKVNNSTDRAIYEKMREQLSFNPRADLGV